jgi:CheY-like chemotaxis protein
MKRNDMSPSTKKTLAMKSLRCPTCAAPIDLSAIEWCHCVSKEPSVICPSCRACFCKVSRSMRGEWNQALRELLERQTAEKFRRALGTTAASSPEGLTILIVDDDEEIRLIAEYSVQQMGYRTLSAANAEEALSIVKDSRPDIVLTDALMPKIDGRQLCRLIKALDPSIKVIVMSSLYTSSRYRAEALSAFRADEYLVKPIDFDKLRQVLDKMTQKAA